MADAIPKYGEVFTGRARRDAARPSDDAEGANPPPSTTTSTIVPRIANGSSRRRLTAATRSRSIRRRSQSPCSTSASPSDRPEGERALLQGEGHGDVPEGGVRVQRANVRERRCVRRGPHHARRAVPLLRGFAQVQPPAPVRGHDGQGGGGPSGSGATRARWPLDALSELIVLTASRCRSAARSARRSSRRSPPGSRSGQGHGAFVAVFFPYAPIEAHRKSRQGAQRSRRHLRQSHSGASYDAPSEPDVLQTFIDARYKDGAASNDQVLGMLIAVLFAGAAHLLHHQHVAAC